MTEAKSTPTPMISYSQLSKYQFNITMNGTQYRSIIGALQYVTITKLEIAYNVDKVSQYMSCPLNAHWKAVKRIMRYLAGTPNHRLHITKSSYLNLKGFSDSN